MKHTPGPWQHAKETHVYDDGETQTYGAGTIYAAVQNEDNGYAVATVYGVPSNVSLEDIKGNPRYATGIANACLIAAAPDLLEALKMWQELWDNDNFVSGSVKASNEIAKVLSITAAAIRKAEEGK